MKLVDKKKIVPSRCVAQVDDIKREYSEFVLGGYVPTTGKVEIMVDADALTILQTSMLLKQAADKALELLDEEERNMVIEEANRAVNTVADYH